MKSDDHADDDIGGQESGVVAEENLTGIFCFIIFSP